MVTDKDGVFTGRVVTLRTNKETAMFQRGYRSTLDIMKYQLTQSKKEILLEVGKNAQARKPIDSVMSTIDKTNHNTRDTIASDLGWSTGKVAMADKVWKEATQEIKEQVLEQQGKRTDICQTSDKCNPIDTKKELAKVANVSHDTIAKVKKIQSTATQEVKDKLESGEVSINEAYKAVKSGNTHVSNNSGENEWYASTVTNILKRA